MKRLIRSSLKNQRIDDLIDDILYQVYENNPETELQDAVDEVVDHVIMVITEMDDDEEYLDYLDFANRHDAEFIKYIVDRVEDKYYGYKWYTNL